jgi:hypothetical protein
VENQGDDVAELVDARDLKFLPRTENIAFSGIPAANDTAKSDRTNDDLANPPAVESSRRNACVWMAPESSDHPR